MAARLPSTPSSVEVTAFLRETSGYVVVGEGKPMSDVVPRDGAEVGTQSVYYEPTIKYMIANNILLGRLLGKRVIYELSPEAKAAK
jgi:hypothetical protein